MKKVAVTGASGHIGANLVRELLGRGHEVTALIRQSSAGLDGLGIQRVAADVRDIASLRTAFSGVNLVYHLAAHISIQPGESARLHAVNVQGTANVLAACQSEGVSTLVHFSSIHALDQHPLGQPVTEENKLVGEQHKEASDYDKSKARADGLVRQNDNPRLNTRIIYPTAVLGPNDFHNSLFGQAIVKMAVGRLPVMVAGGFNWVDARDVARGAVNAAEQGGDRDRFILSGHYRTITEVAAMIAELTGTPAPRFTCSTRLAGVFAPLMEAWARLRREAPIYTRESLATLNAYKQVSHERATASFGYQPRTFRQSVQDALHFYREQNRIMGTQDGD